MRRFAIPPVLVIIFLLVLFAVGSVLFVSRVAPFSFRASLPPDTSSRPPFIVATNPYSVQSIAVGTPYRILLASLKNGYPTRLPDGTLDTLPVSSDPLPEGMTLKPVTIDVPVGTSTQRVQVRELFWQPSVLAVGDHTVTLTSTVTLSGTTFQADPLSITFRVFNPSLSLSNEEILDRLFKRNLINATSSSALLTSLSFDDVLQSMTTEELLRALLAEGMITRYTTYDALLFGLLSQNIDLTPLKPYGILQALAFPPKGGTVLRQKDPNKPWMIVQDTYDDLKTNYESNPFSLLRHFTPIHFLTLLDDRIALPWGTGTTLPMFAGAKETSLPSVAPNVIAKVALTGRRYDGTLKETEAEYRARFPQMALQIKAATDAMPEGKRVIKLQGIDRMSGSLLFDGVFPPLRSSTGALVEAQGYFAPNYDCSQGANPTTCPEGPPSPTGCIDGTAAYKKNHCLFSFWTESPNPEENWTNTVRSRLSAFFREYKRIGGKVDYIVTDLETDWFGLYYARRIWFADHEDHILNDSRWPVLEQEFIDKGIGTKTDGTLDLTDMQLWFGRQDWRFVLWDAVMARRLARMYNHVMYDPIRFDIENGNTPLFPNVQLTDYEFFYRSMLSPSGAYNVFPRNFGSVGDIFGTHQSLSAYADFYAFTLPPGLETDTPNQPQTLFGTFMNDVKHVRTFPLTSRAPSFVWMAHPYWRRYAPDRLNPAFTEPPLQEVDDWFMERMYHLGLSGIEGYLNWTGSNLDSSVKDANSGSLAVYDRGFEVMHKGLQDVNAHIGYADRTPLIMRRVDFQDGYALTGMEVHGKRIYRFTPDPDVPYQVRRVGDGIELWSNDIRIASIPHATSQQSDKGYWITQYAGQNMLTATPDEILHVLQ